MAKKNKEIKVSVVINTLNEEKHIEDVIKSVKQIADEIVVVDMKSIDSTRTIAKKLGAKVYEHERMGYVEPARNFAISKANGKWVFIIDADERAPLSLLKVLKKISKGDFDDLDSKGISKADYYRIPRKNYVFDKALKHSRWWPDYNIRFFRKGYVDWSELIHSVPLTVGDGADLPPEEDYALKHLHYETVEQFIERMNRYTTMQAKNLFDEGKKFVWRDLVVKPSNEFLSRYYQGEGYRDGVHGLALASLQAFSELVLYLKLWQLSKFKKQQITVSEVIDTHKKVMKDMNYWHADVRVRLGEGFLQKARRKLKI